MHSRVRLQHAQSDPRFVLQDGRTPTLFVYPNDDPVVVLSRWGARCRGSIVLDVVLVVIIILVILIIPVSIPATLATLTPGGT